MSYDADLTPYEKDAGTGIVATNCKATVELLSTLRPDEGTQEVADWISARSHCGRVFIPGNNVPYEVIVRSKGVDTLVGEGVTKSPTAKMMTPITVRIRQEPEANEPVEPAPVVDVIEGI